VFLGVGFETTAPGTAVAVQAAAAENLTNFTVFPMLKTVEPALRALIADPAFNVQGFICPGHVAVIIGEEGFKFLPEEFHIPAVIAGFEPEDILLTVYMLCRQIKEGKPRMENEYTRAVAPEGNPLAMAVMDRYLAPASDMWRGLGEIPGGALMLRDSFSAFDARKKFDIRPKYAPDRSGCRCGEVIQGKLAPNMCPLFGKACTPEEPVGPCMVSSEGACAAAYKYELQ
jgi:hydrogenase expression/formation protein HypD